MEQEVRGFRGDALPIYYWPPKFKTGLERLLHQLALKQLFV